MSGKWHRKKGQGCEGLGKKLSSTGRQQSAKMWLHRPRWLLLLLVVFVMCIGGRNNESFASSDFVEEDGKLFDLVEIGDLGALQSLLDADESDDRRLLKIRNEGGHTLLHWASSLGQLEVVRLLLVQGSELGSSNEVSNGFQAMHWAASNGFDDVARLLVEYGAPLEAMDFNGRTPLHLACERGHRDIALFLVKEGASITAESHDLKTSLHYAAFSGLLQVVQLLVKRGVDVNSRTKWGDTALHYASSGTSMGHVKIIQLLLDRGADVDALGMQGDTPFHWACWKGLSSIAELLVRHGADMHWPGYQEDDSTPFSLGACESEPLRTKLLAAYEQEQQRCSAEGTCKPSKSESMKGEHQGEKEVEAAAAAAANMGVDVEVDVDVDMDGVSSLAIPPVFQSGTTREEL